MQIVGVDFGTTNVRIATWDSDQDLPPQPNLIGAQDATTMPAVIALQQQAEGGVSFIVGEEADSLVDNFNTLVIRNIKRYALSSDAYVDWHLEVRNTHEQYPKWPPKWWNQQEHCVQEWGQEFPVWDLIRHILAEAFRRAGISGEFQWRAGCPVHANFEYRNGLAQALSQLTGRGNTSWIVEEPILFLTLARRLGDLTDGSYLAYDLGGGSFDSALVEVRGDEMLVYGADGHPLLGGSDIDDMLNERLLYTGQLNLLRQAKERLTPSNPSDTLNDGTVVTWSDVEATLREGGFIKKSLSTMRDAYIGAKMLWKRGQGDDDPPIDEIIARNRESGAVRFVWQLKWDDMAKDMDGIILFGGPTKSPYFYQHLSKQFGAEKVIAATDLFPTLTGTPDLELVGISLGACYSYEDFYSPLYLYRLPVQVTLENLQTGDKVEYEPYNHLAVRLDEPFEPFVSKSLPQQIAAIRSPLYPKTYQLTITHPDGTILRQDGLELQEFIDKHINDGLTDHTLRLVIDHYGRVGVEQESDKTGPKRFLVFEQTPWQTGEQRQALKALFEQDRTYQEEARQRGFVNASRIDWLHRD